MRRHMTAALMPMILAGLTLTASVACAAQATFHVEVKGQGQPMILIPGLASSGQTWDSTVAHYASQYQCHVLTLAGFAGQTPVSGFSLPRVAEDLSQYITAHKLDHPVIVGHSLGGFLALELAIHHPDQVGKLVIVDSLPAMGAIQNPDITPQQLQSNATQMQAGMLSMSEEQRLSMAKGSIATMVTNPADAEQIYAWAKASDWHTEAVAMSELAGTDLRSDVSKINAPTLVLGTWIAYAAYANEAAVQHTFEQQYAKLPGVQIALAAKARHFIMYDDPQWMFAQTDQFLSPKTAAR